MTVRVRSGFPFLFGGTFIEGHPGYHAQAARAKGFPFLFGGTFIEGLCTPSKTLLPEFPFLFGGTFIEGN